MRFAPLLIMDKRLLTVPQLMFIIGTRAALAAGVGMLASRRLSDRGRKKAGLTLAAIGVATTIPAARIMFRSRAR